MTVWDRMAAAASILQVRREEAVRAERRGGSSRDASERQHDAIANIREQLARLEAEID